MSMTPHHSASSKPPCRTNLANLASLPTELKIKIALAIAGETEDGTDCRRALSSLTLVNHEWQEVCEPIAHEHSSIDTRKIGYDGAVLLPPQRLRRFLRSVTFHAGPRVLAPLIGDLLAPSKGLETLRIRLCDFGNQDDSANTLDQLRPFVEGLRKLDIDAYGSRTHNLYQAAARLLNACTTLRELCIDLYPPEYARSELLEAFDTFIRAVFALSTLRRLEIWRSASDIGNKLQLDWPELRQLKVNWATSRDIRLSETVPAWHFFLLSLPKSLVSICVYCAYVSPIDRGFTLPPSTIAFPHLTSFSQRGDSELDILFLIDPATPIRRLVYDDFSYEHFVAADKFRDTQPVKTLAEVAYKRSRLSSKEETDFHAWAHRYNIKITDRGRRRDEWLLAALTGEGRMAEAVASGA
ncbi:hypothetical protein JCM10908_002471 [Rhodotorula pacifica]|uniref:uncharacterized protein n=1 Tax=Rhodotorula pacifica TaxID=1495444 RepID=UPI0031773258